MLALGAEGRSGNSGSGKKTASSSASTPATSTDATATSSAPTASSSAASRFIAAIRSQIDRNRNQRDDDDDRRNSRRATSTRMIWDQSRATSTATTSLSIYQQIAATSTATSSAGSIRSALDPGAGIGFRSPRFAAAFLGSSATSGQYAGGLSAEATASAALGALGFGLLGSLMAAGKITLFGLAH